MLFIRCPFCHRKVFRWSYAAHEARHTRRRPDGQQEEHATLPPERRFTGPLDGVPQVYRHASCGVETRMPEDVVRSYLVDPFMYTESSFCGGCGDYVDVAELSWVETGQTVLAYMVGHRLRYLEEEFGMDPASPSAPAVCFTPRAVRAIRDILKQEKLSPNTPVEVRGNPDESGFIYKLDLYPNPEDDDGVVSFRSAGIRVRVAEEDLKLFKQLAIDHVAGKGGTGFRIGRVRC